MYLLYRRQHVRYGSALRRRYRSKMFATISAMKFLWHVFLLIKIVTMHAAVLMSGLYPVRATQRWNLVLWHNCLARHGSDRLPEVAAMSCHVADNSNFHVADPRKSTV